MMHKRARTHVFRTREAAAARERKKKSSLGGPVSQALRLDFVLFILNHLFETTGAVPTTAAINSYALRNPYNT